LCTLSATQCQGSDVTHVAHHASEAISTDFRHALIRVDCLQPFWKNVFTRATGVIVVGRHCRRDRGGSLWDIWEGGFDRRVCECECE
jgi:hypothetical protein